MPITRSAAARSTSVVLMLRLRWADEVDAPAGERGLGGARGRRAALVEARGADVGGDAAIGEELSEQALGHRRAALVGRAQEQDPRGVDGASVVATGRRRTLHLTGRSSRVSTAAS